MLREEPRNEAEIIEGPEQTPIAVRNATDPPLGLGETWAGPLQMAFCSVGQPTFLAADFAAPAFSPNAFLTLVAAAFTWVRAVLV